MKKNNAIFINRISEKLIHEQKTKDGSRTFYNVSFSYADAESGYAAFAVNPQQLLKTTNKDGTIVEGMKNILLGAPENTRKVTFRKNGEFTYVEKTNAEIARMIAEDREAYLKRVRRAS